MIDYFEKLSSWSRQLSANERRILLITMALIKHNSGGVPSRLPLNPYGLQQAPGYSVKKETDIDKKLLMSVMSIVTKSSEFCIRRQ